MLSQILLSHCAFARAPFQPVITPTPPKWVRVVQKFVVWRNYCFTFEFVSEKIICQWIWIYTILEITRPGKLNFSFAIMIKQLTYFFNWKTMAITVPFTWFYTCNLSEFSIIRIRQIQSNRTSLYPSCSFSKGPVRQPNFKGSACFSHFFMVNSSVMQPPVNLTSS